MHLPVGVPRCLLRFRFPCPPPFRSPISMKLVPLNLSSWPLSLVLHRPHFDFASLLQALFLCPCVYLSWVVRAPL